MEILRHSGEFEIVAVTDKNIDMWNRMVGGTCFSVFVIAQMYQEGEIEAAVIFFTAGIEII